MTYHNLVKIVFALSGVSMLVATINFGGDMLFAAPKPKVAGYVVAVATPAPTPSPTPARK
jgi:hypothetical protein